MTLKASAIIQNAFSNIPHKHVLFARGIAELSTIMEPEWNRNQLIPFLANWLDYNDNFLCEVIASQITFLGIRCQGIGFTFPIISTIILSQSKTAKQKLKNGIMQFKGDKTGLVLIKTMLKSDFDDIRAFIPKIITIINNHSERIAVFDSLIKDKSFCVKFALLKEIPKYEKDTAKNLVLSLLDDKNDKIRSFIPAATVRFSFFLTTIVPRLIDDPSWQVKTALAHALPSCIMPSTILSSLIELTRNPAWEVQITAIRSLTQIVHNNPSIKIREVNELFEDLSQTYKSTSQNSMKNTIVDAFLTILSKTSLQIKPELQNSLVNIVLSDKSMKSRLYFFSKCAEFKCQSLKDQIEEKFNDMFERFTNDRIWTTRFEACNSLPTFKEYFTDPDVQEMLEHNAFELLQDTSQETRTAAAKFIASLSKGDNHQQIIQFLDEKKNAKSFRERQGVVMILSFMISEESDDNAKEELIKRLKELENDRYSVVSQLAKDRLKSNQKSIQN